MAVSMPTSACVQQLRMYRGVGKTNKRITHRVQIAAQTRGEAFLAATQWNPDVDWTIIATKRTSQPILGWCYCG